MSGLNCIGLRRMAVLGAILVALVLSATVAMGRASAAHDKDHVSGGAPGYAACPPGFVLGAFMNTRDADRNGDGKTCEKFVGNGKVVEIDNVIPGRGEREK